MRSTLSSASLNVRRDLVVLTVLIGAMMLLIWNGTTFFKMMSFAGEELSPGIKIAWTALTLNVALILFGWRRYVDLLHENERRVEGEARARQMATTDVITGLLNRKGFADAARALAEDAATRGKPMAMISLQLHRFRSVNDRHGYDVGDRSMRLLADALREALPGDALAARLSGDEFALCFVRDSATMREVVDLTADRLLRSVTRPFGVEGKTIQVGAFIGIAVSDGQLEIPDLLRRAEIALNHGRSTRVARPVWFDDGMERALVAHGEIEQGIRYGLEHDQFLPFFEPQVDLQTGEIVGFEVLARWDHPINGIIAPDVFIPVAEEMNLIGRLSETIIRKALLAAASWDPAIRISVNISPTQLADSWLAQRIVRLLAECRFPAERLVVEITESSLFADIELARAIVTSLKNQGVLLALDDFGSGFSSLSHLRSLPFDAIKLDRSFVANFGRDRESSAIVRAVATLAAAIDVPVTAEGVEEASVHEGLVGLGCAVGQGWYFGKPMPAAQAARLLADRRVEPAPSDSVFPTERAQLG